MARPAEVILSTQNLLHNIRVLQKRVGPSKIIAMVKANAYGHGIRSVALRIHQEVAMFGVSSLEEAMMLRKQGISTPIMLAEGVFEAQEWPQAAAENCEVVLHHGQQIAWLEEGDWRGLPPLRVWVKVNTGMNRLGFYPQEVPSIYAKLSHNPRIAQPIGLMGHFASSEVLGHPKTTTQSLRMREVAASIPGFSGPLSLCNSGGVLNCSEDHGDYVRPGLLIHGVSPTEGVTGASLGLLPVMTLQSALISVYRAKKGEEVGYGGLYTCPEDMPMGIVAMGYGDGYPFSAAHGTPMLVKGVACPLIGRVSMDMLAVDLRPCPRAHIGDPVVLWGAALPVETVASFTREIPYTLLTGLHHRVRCTWLP